jgi:hypothetical protein
VGFTISETIGRYDKDKIQRLFDPEFRKKDLKWRFLIGETGACQP